MTCMLGLPLLQHLTAHFSVRPDLVFVRRSQNSVYRAFDEAGEPCVLRISHGRFRTRREVEAELKWVNHLVKQGVRACAAIPGSDGVLYHEVCFEGENYIAACFRHAPGEPVLPRGPDLLPYLPHYEELGVLVGQLHQSAGLISRAESEYPRAQWHESRLLRQDFEALGGYLSPAFRRSVANLIEELREEPVKPSVFGLIHGDVSFSNCHFEGGRPWIFDFDNCEYGYFVQDIATVLYDSIYCKALNQFADDGLCDRMAPLLKAFLVGYSKTGGPVKLPVEQLMKFFLLREAVIYGHYHRTLIVADLPDTFRKGMEVMRRNVEEQTHQVDFTKLLGR